MHTPNRRAFLQRSAGALVGASAMTATVSAEKSANEKLNIAIVGLRIRGKPLAVSRRTTENALYYQIFTEHIKDHEKSYV